MRTDNLTEEQKTLLLLDKLGDAIRGMYARLDATHQAINEVERLGWADAKPHWRAGKYLYLIYPMVDSERKREYIGVDPEKVADAMDRIERKAEYEKLGSDLASLQSKLSRLRSQLTTLLGEAYRD